VSSENLKAYKASGMNGCIGKGKIISTALENALKRLKDNPEEFVVSQDAEEEFSREAKTKNDEDKKVVEKKEVENDSKIIPIISQEDHCGRGRMLSINDKVIPQDLLTYSDDEEFISDEFRTMPRIGTPKARGNLRRLIHRKSQSQRSRESDTIMAEPKIELNIEPALESIDPNSPGFVKLRKPFSFNDMDAPLDSSMSGTSGRTSGSGIAVSETKKINIPGTKLENTEKKVQKKKIGPVPRGILRTRARRKVKKKTQCIAGRRR